MTINELLDKAIEHVASRLVNEWDAEKIEKLANALQSITYSAWQHMQPRWMATGVPEGAPKENP